MRLIVLLKLKPGADRAAYETWVRTADIPGVRRLGSVAGYSVHKATGLLGTNDPAPYDYVEVLDVADPDGFAADVASPEVQALAAGLSSFAEATFITTEAVEPA
jgi:hypothetical protein